MFKGIRTVEDLRSRPVGWSFADHVGAVRSAGHEHALAAVAIGDRVEDEDRTELKADEARDFERHRNEGARLDHLLDKLDDSTEGKRAMLSTVIQADGGESRAGFDMQARVSRPQLTYRPDDPQRGSWIKDMVRASDGDQEARGRLHANNREFAGENRALAGNISGAVGEFVPPVWLTAQLVRVARAQRVYADQINGQPLTVRTNSINIPRLASGTATAKQATENSNVQNTDATSDSISATVATLAGQQIVSVQLLDQSPVPVDQILLEDLAADLAVKIDQFALSSNSTGMLGIFNTSGTNAVTFTTGSPTAPLLYPKIADAIQRISTSRFMPPDKIFMHPRRWAWLTAALDSSNRPLVVPAVSNPMNSMAAQGGVVAEGFVGSIQGIPIFVDPNVPINTGSGTNQDPIIVTRSSDSYLWESPQVALVDRWSLSGQLSVRLVLRSYVAVQHARYPVSTSIVNGTGLITPTF